MQPPSHGLFPALIKSQGKKKLQPNKCTDLDKLGISIASAISSFSSDPRDAPKTRVQYIQAAAEDRSHHRTKQTLGPREQRLLRQILAEDSSFTKDAASGGLLEPENTKSAGKGQYTDKLDGDTKLPDMFPPCILKDPIFYERGIAIDPLYLFPHQLIGDLIYAVYPPLPSGLSLDCKVGVVSGTPSVLTCDTVSSLPPMNTWTMTAKDHVGRVVQRIQFQVHIIEPPWPIEYMILFAQYMVNEPIACNAPRQAVGRFVRFSVEPPLPHGLTIDEHGRIEGTPAEAQNPAQYLITAANALGSSSTSIIISVLGAVPLFRYDESRILTLLGIPIDPIYPVAQSPADAWPGRFDAAPPLPLGLRLDPATGAISGTPAETTSQPVLFRLGGRTHCFHAGRLPWRVRCCNGVSEQATSVSIAVLPAPELRPTQTAATFLLGRFATPIMFTPGGAPAGVRFRVSPRLPRGLVLNRCTGTLGGVPREICADGSLFTVCAESEEGVAVRTARVALRIGVLDAPHGLRYRLPRALYCVGERTAYPDRAALFESVRRRWSRQHLRTAIRLQRLFRRRRLRRHLAVVLRRWLATVRSHRVEKLQVRVRARAAARGAPHGRVSGSEAAVRVGPPASR
jgi:hypothetical protein